MIVDRVEIVHADVRHGAVPARPQDPAALHVSRAARHISHELLCRVRKPLQMRHDAGILRYRCGEVLWRISDLYSPTRLCARAHT